jgi:hypothetical protein
VPQNLASPESGFSLGPFFGSATERLLVFTGDLAATATDDLILWQINIAHAACDKSNPSGKSVLIYRKIVKPRNQKYFASQFGKSEL